MTIHSGKMLLEIVAHLVSFLFRHTSSEHPFLALKGFFVTPPCVAVDFKYESHVSHDAHLIEQIVVIDVIRTHGELSACCLKEPSVKGSGTHDG
ncbi:MAG: hypothetical protein A4E62_02116 [Syntrophorhabdus sp. PtaU1.Bin002]|nr:MAG: hypothetical protein A4E62_02116 [Syntrophorhabdus sp. PtaU1.Bin002]